ncbi:RICIN domain-containing protein [Ruminococcus sp.]|uniref:RICIN domain-containing protein n=1 Tax=Ruminococcus sp. TaxID=41978 RepID=UPI0025E3E6A9|nr:RICIN domain-containing protein [Ruminococcus sp.]
MKKLSKPFISIFITIVMIITVIPMSAFAANYSVNYWEHSEPTRQLYYNGGSQMYGDDVKWFQCAINNLVMNGDINNSQLNTPKLDVDGYFGNASKKALLDFQTKYSLAVDGYFGPDSRAKMKSMLKSGSSSSSSYTPPVRTYPTSPRTIKDGVYRIRNKNSRKYIDVYNNERNQYTRLIQYTGHGGKNQLFKIVYENDGYYSIHPYHALDMAIDLHSQSESNTNGSDAFIYPNGNYIEQRFTIKNASGGGYEIGTKESNGNKVLEVTNSSCNDGEYIQIWDRSSTRSNDNWELELVPQVSETLFDLNVNKLQLELELSSKISAYFGKIIQVKNGVSERLIGRYTVSECIDKIFEYDGLITNLSNLYSIPKAAIQKILLRELYCYDVRDIGADILVGINYNEDSSTGLAQIFAATAIKTNNWAVENGIICGNTYNLLLDKKNVWTKLKDDNNYNISMVPLILMWGVRDRGFGTNYYNYSVAQMKKMLSIYNGDDGYGEEIYPCYETFRKYN